MKVTATRELPEVLLLELDVYADTRGHFFECFNEERFAALGLPTHFRQNNQSRSVRHVIRGLHYQLEHPQGKLVQCIRGAVFDVAADIRVGSPTFATWTAVELCDEKKQLLWIPPGFAHGFCALSDVAEIQYQCTDLYDRDDDRGVNWADPQLAIPWPAKTPILSDRDRALPPLSAAWAALPRYEQRPEARGR